MILVCLPVSIAAQPNFPSEVADSLMNIWNDEKLPDTTRLKAMDQYAWDGYLFTDPDSAFHYAQKEIDFINARLNGKKKNTHLLKIKSSAFNTQGASFHIRGNLARAVEYYTKCLKIKEEIGDKTGEASTLNNIGLIYKDQNDLDRALEYLKRCLEIEKSLKDTLGVGTTLGNIGSIYQSMEKNDVALDYHMRSLKILEPLGELRSRASSLSNIALIYQDDGKLNLALKNLEKSMELRQQLGDQRAISSSLNLIGDNYRLQKNYTLALRYSHQSLKLSEKIGATSQTMSAAKSLWKTYKNLGQYKESLKWHELFVKLQDSINSEENRQEVIRQEYEYEYEKQAALDSATYAQEQALINARIAKQNAESDKKDAELAAKVNQQYALFGGLALLIIFAGFMYNRFRITQKQKNIIELQKSEAERQKGQIEAAHREITDSIQYAKRIQGAILPPEKMVKELLPRSFVLYKPKDVVAGDFYWLETITKAEDETPMVLFAAADCTGHGVPGAMVSVICNNGLNRSVREYGLTDPGEILTRTREIVIQEFEKSEEDVQDGMDIALCTIQGRELNYSGANNPLWIIRKGASAIEEIKADKQPIGKFSRQSDFRSHGVTLQEGDTIYVFSDGFVDQFGGDFGKKFKTMNMKRLLLSIQHQSMDDQGKELAKAFEEWKGEHEQIDDVCIIGVRV